MKGPCGVRYRSSDGKRDKTPVVAQLADCRLKCMFAAAETGRARVRSNKGLYGVAGDDLKSV